MFEFLDYREVLRALYAEKKARDYGFSHRAFSRRAGLKSINFLKLVMDGQRNLSAELAPQFALGMSLSAGESEYFCALVQYDQARSGRERSAAYARVLRAKPGRVLRVLDGQQAAYHSNWYVPAIRELAARRDFEASPAWIASKLVPSISLSQAARALEILTALGLLTADANGKLRPTDEHVSTGPTPLGHQIADYHRAMIERAGEAIDLFPREEREISSLTLCVDEAVLPELKRRLQEFRRELMELAEAHGERTRVMQVNFQLFPLSKKET